MNFELLTRSLNLYLFNFLFLIIVSKIDNHAGEFRQKYSSTIVSNVFLLKLWRTELKGGNVWCIAHQNMIRYIPLDK